MTPLRAHAPIMCLFANGVDELQFTEMQRALLKAGYKVTTVAASSGVVQSWHGESWGHFYPVDQVMGDVLGSDFDALVLPGGARAAQKLRDNLHCRRLINHFMEAQKPVAAIGEAVGLLALSPRLAGYDIAALPADGALLQNAQARFVADAVAADKNLVTAAGPVPGAWVGATVALFSGQSPLQLATLPLATEQPALAA